MIMLKRRWYVSSAFKDISGLYLIHEFMKEKGTAEPCVTTQLIERTREKPESEDDEIVARHITATAYTGKVLCKR